jgi:hypothetical protein
MTPRERVAELARQARTGEHWASPEPPVPAETRSGPASVPYRAPVAVRERGTVAGTRDRRGEMLLDYIAAYFDHYVAISPRNRDAVTLWNGHAAARDRDDTGLGKLIWRATPRLMLTSSDRGSGKSTVLDLSRYLQGNPARMPKVTGRSLASRLGRKHEAVMLDEVKLLFGAGSASKDVQGILLDGYTPGGVWGTTSGQKDVDIPCFGPVAYAAKDELVTATADALGDLFDRSITIRMVPASRIMPEVDEIAEDEGAQLARALVLWTDEKRGELKAAARDLAVADREAGGTVSRGEARLMQIWRPLRAVAAVAGGTWPERAESAMSAMRTGGQSDALSDALAGLQATFGAPALRADSETEPNDDWDDES